MEFAAKASETNTLVESERDRYIPDLQIFLSTSDCSILAKCDDPGLSDFRQLEAGKEGEIQRSHVHAVCYSMSFQYASTSYNIIWKHKTPDILDNAFRLECTCVYAHPQLQYTILPLHTKIPWQYARLQFVCEHLVNSAVDGESRFSRVQAKPRVEPRFTRRYITILCLVPVHVTCAKSSSLHASEFWNYVGDFNKNTMKHNIR